MLLASRKLRAAFAYICLVSKRELVLVVDKVISIGLVAYIIHHLFDLLIVHVLVIEAVADVLSYSSRKQHWLLLYDSDLIMVPFWIEFLDVNTIEKDLTFIRVVEALDQLNNRRFTASTRTDESHNSLLVVVYGEGNTFEHLDIAFARIAEFYIPELKLALSIATKFTTTLSIKARHIYHHFVHFV